MERKKLNPIDLGYRLKIPSKHPTFSVGGLQSSIRQLQSEISNLKSKLSFGKKHRTYF
jgi:hypothetical protein